MSEYQLPPFFYEIFYAGLPRLGPGSEATTQQALDMLYSAGESRSGLKALDVGCGNGAQTIDLAKQIDGTILAVDNHRPFLDELERRAAAAGVSQMITARLEDMSVLLEEDETYDLIWSEGALFCMGFQAGIEACRRRLRPGGRMAASELCWLRPDVPAECREFFAGIYPAIASVEEKLHGIEKCEFREVRHFIEPETCWREGFYNALGERVRELWDEHAGDAEKLPLLEATKKEIAMYEKYSAYYGYGFFVMRG